MKDHYSRPQKQPLSPETIIARLLVSLIVIGIFVSVFILPWVFK